MEVQEIDLGNGSKGVDWRPFAEPLKADPEVAPHLEKITEKDVGSVVKGYVHLQRKLGTAVNIPGKDSKEEDRKAFLDKVYSTGLIERAPESPDKYELAKPEQLPPGVEWNDEIEQKARAVFKEAGITNAQAQKLVPFYLDLVGGFAGKQMTTYETGMEAIKKEWGADYNANAELVARAGKHIFGDDAATVEFFDKTGVNNDPRWLKVMAKVGKALEADDGFIKTSGSASDDAATAHDIMSNPQNPKHELWKKGDAATIEYINSLFKKVNPGTVVIS